MAGDTRIERVLGMSDAVWTRHANPWSFYTRVPILPLAALFIYARIWIGWWCLIPITGLIVWVVVNPRAFPPPQRFDHYTSRAVLGERVYLSRHTHPIPRHHVRAVRVLEGVSLLGLPFLIYGLFVLDIFMVLMGLVLTVGAKLWLLDRMVWIYDTVGEGRFTPPPSGSPGPETAH